MPQDDLRTDTDFNRQPRGGARQEQMRGENTAAAEAMSARMAEIGANRLNGGLRMQTEMAETLQAIGREWMERRALEAEFALSLPNRLASVRTYAEALAVYQQWLNGWLALCQEDGQRFLSDGQRIMASGMRCFTNNSPAAPS
jgi:hypothetical protein